MADIELVVKIPEEIRLALIYNIQLSMDQQSICDSWIKHAIITGTLLPKGHGRLIDEKELKKEAIRCEWSRNMYDKLDHTLSYMKPIIEADRSVENDKRREDTTRFRM